MVPEDSQRRDGLGKASQTYVLTKRAYAYRLLSHAMRAMSVANTALQTDSHLDAAEVRMLLLCSGTVVCLGLCFYAAPAIDLQIPNARPIHTTNAF